MQPKKYLFKDNQVALAFTVYYMFIYLPTTKILKLYDEFGEDLFGQIQKAVSMEIRKVTANYTYSEFQKDFIGKKNEYQHADIGIKFEWQLFDLFGSFVRDDKYTTHKEGV